ncbi:alpha/beta fold hydrolase [Halobacteriovorax sp. HLS]|uniref:alpha/beta fold hydrolase n=1 Tax=Halobacteriovorax sp. HLS TaxID=2234000 RepID=UPI000FDB96F8|nr:alpha/beta hydrolase [Halobacteriovorax sp. HLS]
MMKSEFPSYYYSQDGTRIFYITNFDHKLEDKSNVIVFNYGLVCNHSHFKPQIQFFDDLGYKILIHDYRAHYSSSGQENLEACTFENMAKDINGILKSLNIINPIIIGHSMGVNVSLEYAKLFPNEIRSLVLISGTVLPPQDIMFDSNIVDIAAPLIEKFSNHNPNIFNYLWKNSFKNPLARWIVLDGGFNTKKVEDSFVQIYMKKISELSKELFFHLLEKMKQHSIISHLENINTPTLIIGGDSDKIIPNYLQKILHKYLKNSDLYIVKDGSHVPQIDFPELLNERILSFIKRY